MNLQNLYDVILHDNDCPFILKREVFINKLLIKA